MNKLAPDDLPWAAIYAREHAAAFMIANMLPVDLLRDVPAVVEKAPEDGQTVQMFRDAVRRVIT